MAEQNNIEKVHLIEDNEYKEVNKIVSKINYKNFEIAVLKQDIAGSDTQELLFKDNNNEYWKMGIAPIKFKEFLDVIMNEKNSFNKNFIEKKAYCDNVLNAIKDFDFKTFFENKINNNRYFNMCELAYISKNYPEMYDNALSCRNAIIDKNRAESEQYRTKLEEEKKEEVTSTNSIFEQQLDKIKEEIRHCGIVKAVNFEFYKDNDYKNGKTTQNCFLYLANEYGVKIPLATKGFINNRITQYDFAKGNYWIVRDGKRMPTCNPYEYFNAIYKGVVAEYEKNKETIKNKSRQLLLNSQ